MFLCRWPINLSAWRFLPTTWCWFTLNRTSGAETLGPKKKKKKKCLIFFDVFFFLKYNSIFHFTLASTTGGKDLGLVVGIYITRRPKMFFFSLLSLVGLGCCLSLSSFFFYTRFGTHGFTSNQPWKQKDWKFHLRLNEHTIFLFGTKAQRNYLHLETHIRSRQCQTHIWLPYYRIFMSLSSMEKRWWDISGWLLVQSCA